MLVMTLDEYQYQAGETAVYPGRGTVQGLLYATLGLAGEAGECANQVKKILRDDLGVMTAMRKENLIKELGDVLWYVAAVAEELGVGLGYVAMLNLKKLQERKNAGTITGDGGER